MTPENIGWKADGLAVVCDWLVEQKRQGIQDLNDPVTPLFFPLFNTRPGS